jgi:hypothetical protein
MPRKCYTPKEIVAKLLQVEEMTAQGGSLAQDQVLLVVARATEADCEMHPCCRGAGKNASRDLPGLLG